MEPESLSYAFGPFVLDRSRRLLWREGTLVSLTPKAFDILSLLVERSGAVVEKDVIFLETLLAYAAVLAGKEEHARAILRAIEDNAADRAVASFNMALPYAALGGRDRAFYRLDRALKERLYLLRTIHVEQGYEPLRADPRYHDLIGQLGLGDVG